MKKLSFIIIIALFSFGCSLDQLPSDGLVNESLSQNYEGLLAATDGNYSMLKDYIIYDGSLDARNAWVRQFHQLSEFPSDNVMLSGSTTDPLFFAFTREHFATMFNTAYVWYISYKIINGTNQIIDALDEGLDDSSRQLLGENYFLRAYMHLGLLKLFALPYTHGVDNPGVVLKTSLLDEPEEARSTVGQCYDQIESDLLKAEELMDDYRGAAYANKAAAQALLSRIYLHMERWQDAVDYADLAIGDDQFELETGDNYINSFWNASQSSEAMFYVAHLLQDDKGFGAIGSMYLTDQSQGWGEIYPSETLRNILEANPEDVRNGFIKPDYDVDGVTVKQRNGYPKYFITKFSYQDDVVTLNSPQMIRLSEVYLNKAEALAHLGQNDPAITIVNTIRTRAGLSGTALYADASDLKGFASVLDVVLNERRIELAWEGFRVLDLIRNKKDIDRSYPGVHLDQGESTQIIPWDDARNIYFIPANEVLNNPMVVQNP